MTNLNKCLPSFISRLTDFLLFWPSLGAAFLTLLMKLGSWNQLFHLVNPSHELKSYSLKISYKFQIKHWQFLTIWNNHSPISRDLMEVFLTSGTLSGVCAAWRPLWRPPSTRWWSFVSLAVTWVQVKPGFVRASWTTHSPHNSSSSSTLTLISGTIITVSWLSYKLWSNFAQINNFLTRCFMNNWDGYAATIFHQAVMQLHE